MTRLAITSQPGFEISLLDAPNLDAPNPAGEHPANAAPNYTFDTLTKLRQSQPEDACLFLLLGADSFRTIHHWYRASDIPFLANLIVASRPGEDLSNPSVYLPSGIEAAEIPNQPNHYLVTNPTGEQSPLTILPDLNYDISATQLRLQIQGPSGKESQLLDPAVLNYIRHHHLYEQP